VPNRITLIGASLLLLAGCAGVQSVQLSGPAAALHDASQSGNLEEARAIVTAEPALLDSKGAGLNTPLSWAAFHGHLELVQYLVNQGADIEAQNGDGCRPLHAVAINNHKEIARYIIEEGAVIEATCWRFGTTPLDTAAHDGSPDVLQFLISRGANVDTDASFPPLHYVAGAGFASLVDLMLAKGAPVNEADPNGKTPLHYAAAAGYQSQGEQMARKIYVAPRHEASIDPEKWPREPLLVVESLLASGADVNAKSGFAETPLHVAAEAGRPEIARLLLRHGAQPNARERYELTPLFFAVKHGRESMVRLLLEHGADVNAAHRLGWTPLSEAAGNGYVRLCRLLIESGADVNAGSDGFQMPLVNAANWGHEEVVVLLVESGADVSVKYRSGYRDRSVLYRPRQKGYTNIVLYLESHGAKD